MARYLRQSTVATVKLGPFVAPSDGLTPFAAGGFAVKVGAAGGTLAARHDATAIAHDADGYYAVELDATDTATVGRLKAEVPGSAGNYLPVWDDFTVLSGAVYDVLFGGTAPSTYAGTDTAGTTTLLGRLTSTRAANLDNIDVLLSSRLATASYVAAPTAAAIATAVWTDTTASDFTQVGSPGKAVITYLDIAVSTRSTYAGGAVTLDLTGLLGSPRALDAVADAAITLNDALWCAVAGAAGKESVVGTTYAVKTPSTGTAIRSFTLDNGTAPTSRS